MRTIADLRRLDLSALETRFGRYGVRLYELARGVDESKVVPDRPTQSISAEDTFELRSSHSSRGSLTRRMKARTTAQTELRGLQWTDYLGSALSVNRSIWKTFVNKPKTRASANPVPVIRQLAEILDAYRSAIGDPSSGVMFQAWHRLEFV